MASKRKGAPLRGAPFHMSLPISRILYSPYRRTTAIFLSRLLPDGSSGTSASSADTALHTGKSLAVSLPRFHGHIPEGTLCLSALASLLASHGLLRTGVTRYLAPADEAGCVRTFL